MVELIPNEISRNEPQSEILVFEAFKASTKGKDWQVIHSVKFSKSVKNIAGEVDFVVLVPGTGIVLIEAKGATGFKLTKKGWEIYGVPEETKNSDPFDQVIGAERNIRAQLRKLDLDDRSIVVSRLVWFPKINPNKGQIDDNHTGTSFENYEIAFAEDLNDPIKKILKALEGTIRDTESNENLNPSPGQFSAEVSETFVNHLTGNFEASQSLMSKHLARKKELQKVSDEQSKIIDLILDNAKIYFSGPAGSGKSSLLTKLALHSAKTGHEVLITCHNIMMADWLNEQLGAHPKIRVTNLDDLLLEIVGLESHRSTNLETWFGKELPEMVLAKISDGARIKKYSALVIDEFQDIAPNPIKLEILSKLTGRMNNLDPKVYLAGDDNQQILGHHNSVNSVSEARKHFGQITHIQLNQNVRQTEGLSKSIYTLLQRPNPFKTYFLHKEFNGGLEVVPVNSSNKRKRLATVLQRLNGEYLTHEIRVLCFEKEKSVLSELFAEIGSLHAASDKWLAKNCRHQSSPLGEIRWRSIRKFKGLDQDAIVITDVSQASKDWVEQVLGKSLKDLLYVGMTRARFKVVLLVEDDLLPSTHNADGTVFKRIEKLS